MEKKVIKLTESDLEKLVTKVIKEEYYSEDNKWDQLERDLSKCIEPLIEKYSKDFGRDSYAVIDAIHQILDGMFQKR